MSNDFPCQYPGCNQTFRRPNNRTQHYNAHHRPVSPDAEPDPAHEFREAYHAKLTALPCDENGKFLSKFAVPTPAVKQDEMESNPYHPFEDRLEFDWAHYHFVQLQSSERKINKGLDLWLAAQLKAGINLPLPWSSAQEMYSTIDEIQEGDAPFETVHFKYTGTLPPNPPSWMTATYELCTRDSRTLLHNQLATTDFARDFSSRPYRQFDSKGDRVWSNLMSGDWAWNEADVIAEDNQTHSAMLVPIIAGSDKTTVSVATGHQEYHPVYLSPGNISNVARRSHGNGVLPVAFLLIPKTLSRVPCLNGHYRRVIYSLGPYIADYPEQVWLACIVQNWCPKCDAHYKTLDDNFDSTHLRSHERTDFIINAFDPGIVWEKHGIRPDVVPFTHGFPRADIHTMLSPDLLHQLIKGTFKDHLVTWVNEYLYMKHTKSRADEIIKDIDHRISAVPPYAGLRRFSEGRDFEQWTGDDSKALMKVYIAAIVGYVPAKMVKCLSTFMDLCYIFRRNVISNSALETAEDLLHWFLELREVFIEEGVRSSISLPRQHALIHYLSSIPLFGSPNGLCSSITESKHIKAVKEPWRRSNRFNALSQMLRAIVRLEKLAALCQKLLAGQFLVGSTAGHYLRALGGLGTQAHGSSDSEESNGDQHGPSDTDSSPDSGRLGSCSAEQKEAAACLYDATPDDDPPGISSIKLAVYTDHRCPKYLYPLADYLNEPGLPTAFNTFLYSLRHPKRSIPADVNAQVNFCGKIYVFRSATTRFYAPSDLCGMYGMYRQQLRCSPAWYGKPRYDTAFVVKDDRQGMMGMQVARLHLLFSFIEKEDVVECALVSWYPLASKDRDPDTGMWIVKPEGTPTLAQRPVQVIPLQSIARGAHLLPRYGVGTLPHFVTYSNALNAFSEYYVNPYIDHHCHEFLA
ncbi:hypothetical protein CPC08DRAFT_768043 [Agrocybe pediades]|nr:hypothetical protein CPC08DRAFT_768043 [Agrocybe pediades]